MIIKEFLPNPIGKDTDGEYIKIFNNEQAAIDLSGWSIKDASGKKYILSNIKLDKDEGLILDYRTTSLNLNNSGETLFLYNQYGKIIDRLSFVGNAREGELIIKSNPEIFENLPQTTGIINPNVAPYQLWLIGLMVSVILASAVVYIIKSLRLYNA